MRTHVSVRRIGAVRIPFSLRCGADTHGKVDHLQPAAPAGPPSYVLLTEILKASGTSTCVDFLNFPDQQVQLEGIRAMLPMTSETIIDGVVANM